MDVAPMEVVDVISGDAGDFAEPALQGRGDGIRHGFRIGAGAGGEDDDGGDVDAGQRGDGEEAIGDDAGKQQSDRQQHGGDGSGDEGSGKTPSKRSIAPCYLSLQAWSCRLFAMREQHQYHRPLHSEYGPVHVALKPFALRQPAAAAKLCNPNERSARRLKPRLAFDR